MKVQATRSYFAECGERFPCSASRRRDIRPALRAKHYAERNSVLLAPAVFTRNPRPRFEVRQWCIDEDAGRSYLVHVRYCATLAYARKCAAMIDAFGADGVEVRDVITGEYPATRGGREVVADIPF